MKRITQIDLQCEDIMWFAKDKLGHILEFTSAGIANVPEFVCADRLTNEILNDFFMNVLCKSTSGQLEVEYEDNQLINEAIELSSKGIFCFDAENDNYYKISSPIKPLKIDSLPMHIREIMQNRYIDVKANEESNISVEHAY